MTTESPIRKMQKQNDYRRHKLFRKMRRRQRAQAEQAQNVAVKALKRKVRQPRYTTGKDNEDEPNVFRTSSGEYVNQKGDTLHVINTLGQDDPRFFTFEDDSGKKYTPKHSITEGTITQAAKPSPLSQVINWSNNYYGDQILGAPARFAQSWRDRRNPIRAILDNGLMSVGPYGIAGDIYGFGTAIRNIEDRNPNLLDWIAASMPATKTVLGEYKVPKITKPARPRNLTSSQLAEYFDSNPNLLEDVDMSATSADGAALRKFFKDDVTPRLVGGRRKQAIDTDNLISDTKYTKAPFYGANLGGFWSKNGGVVLNKDYVDKGNNLQRTVAHETAHNLRSQTGYTPEEAARLNAAYPFSEEYLSVHPHVPQLEEQAATNTEVRRMISLANDNAVGKKLDKLIDSISDEELTNLYTTAYGKDFSKSFQPGMKAQREALKNVALAEDAYQFFGGGRETLPTMNGGKDKHVNIPYRFYKGSDPPNLFRRPDGTYFYQESPGSEEISLTPLNTVLPDPAQWTYVDDEGRRYTPKQSFTIDQVAVTQGDEPSFLDKAVSASNRHYNDPILGSIARWQASWNNDTNLVKKFWDSPFTMVHPYLFGAKAISNLAGNDGIRKTIRLYNNSDGSDNARYAWQRSLAGDILEATMLFPALQEGYRVIKPFANEAAIAWNLRNPKLNTSNRLYTENNGSYTLLSPFGDDMGHLTTRPLSSKAKGISMIESENIGKGVSEDLYNVAIRDAKELGYQGLESGHDLFKPELTMHVTDKFPRVERPNVSLQSIDGKLEFAPDPNQPPIRLLTGTSGKPEPAKITELSNHRINLQDIENQNIQFNEATEEFELIPSTQPLEPPTISWWEATIPQITVDNAAMMTDAQWDAAYNAAVKAGDMTEVQRLRDLHFMNNAPNTVASVDGKPLQLYHGTNGNFTTFDLSKFGSTDGGTFGRGIYTTPVEEYAQLYGKNNMPLYMKLDNPRDYRGYQIGDLIAEKLAFGDYFGTGIGIDGVIGRPSWKGVKGLTEYVSHNPKNIKSSLPITYDDTGDIIPLSKRDNFKLDDIRFMLPWGIIGGGLGFLYVNGREGEFNRGKDSGIHINPRNRGKFNALKKRTGKTTEQLTHSKIHLLAKEQYLHRMPKSGNIE